MTTIQIIATCMMVWGASTCLVALLKPKMLWKTDKIQGFVQLLGEKGTVILFSVLGSAAIGGGVYLLL